MLLHSLLDLGLVGLEVDDEDEGVVIFNLLHGGLSRQRIANDGISVHAISVGRALLGELWSPFESQGLRTTELDHSPDFLHASSKTSFDDLLLGRECLGRGRGLSHLLLGFDLLDGFGVFLGGGWFLDLGRGVGFWRRLLALGLLTRLQLSFLAR